MTARVNVLAGHAARRERDRALRLAWEAVCSPGITQLSYQMGMARFFAFAAWRRA